PQPRLGGRDLDHQVGPLDRFVQAYRFAERRQRVVREARVDLQRDVAVAALSPIPDRAEQVARLAYVLLGQRPEHALARQPRVQFAQLLLIGVAVAHRLLEDRRVRRGANDRVVVEQPLKVPAANRVAREEVHPHALPQRRQQPQRGEVLGGHLCSLLAQLEIGLVRPSTALAREAMFSAVKPSSFNTVVPGAEAPKRSSPSTSPSLPTHFHQLIVAPGSTASRALAACGSTSSRYSSGWDSNSSMHG